MRLKAALIITAIVLIITAVNFSSSLVLTRNTLNATMSEDISLAMDIANDFVSTRIRLYKSNAQTAASCLSGMNSLEMEGAMQELLEEFTDFMAFTVLDRQGILAKYGDSPASINWLDHSKYIKSAFDGQTVISTTKLSETTGKLVMQICTPMRNDNILSVTISGMIFSELLGDFILRDTRSIFMLDEYGTVIAHFLPEFVTSRIIFTDDSANFFNEMLLNGRGLGSYFLDGIEYQCAYAKVSASETGWYIGLSVPMSENLVVKLQNRLLILAVIFFIAGVIAAGVSSGLIAKPYNKTAEQNRRLEELMEETRRLQKELEAALKEAQEASRAKTSFLANMSHEMRTPLNAIVGLSEIILNTEYPPLRQSAPGLNNRGELEDKLGKIHVCGLTLLGIVNDILDISKIESGKLELHPVKYDTPSLINDIVSLNIVRIGEKPVRFILAVDENLPEQLLGDDLRVKQIFNNLLSNAFKYTNSGLVEWKISFEKDGDNIWLVSYIKDTGKGIKNDDIPKLFEDYSQVDAQANRKVESTGLGLSITKRLADMMDGTIAVESEYGKGSTFSIRLRQTKASDTVIGKETACNLINACFTDNKRAQSAKLKRIDLSYASVLVVDDMPTNLDVTKGMLAPYGIIVDCADSGQTAVKMIRDEKRRYDAVFMDHMMPEMDGIETLRVIREEIGTDYARNVPVIALTANAISGNEKIFLEHGFSAFISKPVDTVQLDAVLRKWVRNKNTDREFKTEPKPKTAAAGTSGITIDNVDTKAGLARFAGNEKIYKNVLKSFVINTRPLLDIIKNHLNEGNLSDYAIAVHGIKGSSFGIGAACFGTQAERMERLAITGRQEQVIAENSAFIESAEKLLDSINSALDLHNQKNNKPSASVPDIALLKELREACAEYDMGRIDSIMLRLESFEYEKGGEIVAWLHEQVEDMNFKEISDGNWPVF